MPPISIAPHLQEPLEAMARDMGVDADGLINQALFAWLRINGYVTPGRIVDVSGPPGLQRRVTTGVGVASVPAAGPATEALPVAVGITPSATPARGVGAVVESGEASTSDVAQRPAEEPVDPFGATHAAPRGQTTLFITRDDEVLRVERSPFIIGRGPSCDLIIDSPRVSREHARLTQHGLAWRIEDLGSSNGTWYGGERISERELANGDEFRLGNELLVFALRDE